jgi:exopolysaccharide biosynthesis polyprenyl glycosylphosphotransferase
MKFNLSFVSYLRTPDFFLILILEEYYFNVISLELLKILYGTIIASFTKLKLLEIIRMKKNFRYKHFFAIADFSILLFSFLIAIYVLRNDTTYSFVGFFLTIPEILALLVFSSSLMLLVFQYNGLYRLDIILDRTKHFTHLIKAIYYSSLQIILITFIIDSRLLLNSKLLILFFFFVSLGMFFILRLEISRIIFLRLSETSFKRNVIIVGDGKPGKVLAAKLIYENPIGLNILGFVDDNRQSGDIIVAGKQVLGKYDDLPELINNNQVDELILTIENESYDRFFEILDFCKSLDVPLRITSSLLDIIDERLKIEKYSDIPVINVSPLYHDRFTLSLKRFFDVAISIFGLLVISPLMLFIALMIKLSSPGPILFKQTRIGKDGKPFQFLKFRSMKQLKGEDEDRKKMMISFMKNGVDGSDTKIINESRVTWIGKLIRKTSLDELPQLLNVIKGDMSLVGPRPCLPYEFENYDQWHKRRVSVMPGCTGVWQVWGRSAVNFNDSVVLDMYYVNNMSPWLDLQLIFQTLPVMLFSRGAK